MRITYFSAALAAALVCATLPARANLDTVIAPRVTMTGATVSACSAKAQSALTSTMQSANEAGAGSGMWLGFSRVGSDAAETAVIECHDAAGGAVASVTCSVEVPPSPDTATSLCDKLSAALGGGH